MKKSLVLAKIFSQYLKNKKTLYIYFVVISLLSVLSFIPMFITSNYNYSWLVICINSLLLMFLLLFIFNTLFIDSKYNQLDLLLLSKSKSANQVYFVKWIISLFVINIFIVFNSISTSLIFSIFSSNGTWFLPIMLGSFFAQNLITITLILMFSLFSLVIKNRIGLMVVSLGVVASIFAVSIPLKVLSDQQSIQQNELKYNKNQHHIYANLYYKEGGVFKSKLIERTNYKYLIDNDSIQEGVSNIDAYNPLNWINSMQVSAISRQLSNQKIILNSRFNINSNNFSVSKNFYKEKPKYVNAYIYPTNVKPLFIVSHKEIKETYLDLYKQLLKKGYTQDSFLLVKDFISNNDFWQNPESSYQEVLFESLGLNGEESLMYFLRDKELLFKKTPDIIEWIKDNTSKKFSEMISSIYYSSKSNFNIENITLKNRNQLISSQRVNDNKNPNVLDVEYFKQKLIQFNGTQVNIENKNVSLQKFQSTFPNINNQIEWKEYIDKNSFTLKQLKNVFDSVEKIGIKITYNFHRNDSMLSDFHYAYNNKTTTPPLMVGVSITFFIIAIIALIIVNNKKLKKANMKGF